MFRSHAIRIAQRISDVLDEMLVGDFEYIETSAGLYADIDYHRSRAQAMSGPQPQAMNPPQWQAMDALRRRDVDGNGRYQHPHREPLRSRFERRPREGACAKFGALPPCCPGRLPEQWETMSNAAI